MPDIHQAVLIGAATEKVYSAITSQDGLSAWWTPNAQAKAVLNSVAHFPFGDNYFKEMKITALEPLQLVEWNCIAGADEWTGTTIRFKLLPGDKKSLLHAYPEMQGQIEQQDHDTATLLIFHHDGWKADSLMFAECSYTWGQFLNSLKLFCETGKGRPWPEQHRIQL